MGNEFKCFPAEETNRKYVHTDKLKEQLIRIQEKIRNGDLNTDFTFTFLEGEFLFKMSEKKTKEGVNYLIFDMLDRDPIIVKSPQHLQKFLDLMRELDSEPPRGKKFAKGYVYFPLGQVISDPKFITISSFTLKIEKDVNLKEKEISIGQRIPVVSYIGVTYEGLSLKFKTTNLQ